MIIWGWRIKKIDDLNINVPEITSFCEKHKIQHSIIIGKRYNTLYFVPINYFWAEKRVFKTCQRCTSDYDEVPKRYEKLILDFYNKDITSKDLQNKLTIQKEKYNKTHKTEAKEDQENFKSFLNLIMYILGFIILALLVKYIISKII